jgi:hypothetical protein
MKNLLRYALEKGGGHSGIQATSSTTRFEELQKAQMGRPRFARPARTHLPFCLLA